jgi:hypothetical protein
VSELLVNAAGRLAGSPASPDFVPIAELVLPKNRILELYLSVIEWGPGIPHSNRGTFRHFDYFGRAFRDLAQFHAGRELIAFPADVHDDSVGVVLSGWVGPRR